MKPQKVLRKNQSENTLPLKTIDFEKVLKSFEEKLSDLRGCL